MTGATKLSHFQSFQTQMETARLSRPTWKRRDFKKNFQGFFSTKVETARLKKNFRAFSTEVETARLKKKFQGFFDQGGDGATFATMMNTARLRKRRKSKGNGANGLASANKNWTFKTFANEVETARLSRPRQRRREQKPFHCDRPDQG